MDENTLIITLTFNSAGIIPDFAKSFLKNCPGYEHTVIDNGSSDDTVSAIKNWLPESKLIQLDENTGTSAAWNLAIKNGIISGKKYFWILNPDVLIMENTLESLIGLMDAFPEIGITGPVLLYSHLKDTIESAGGSFNSRTGKGSGLNWNNIKLAELSSGVMDVDYVDGGTCLIRRSLIEKTGLFDEDYFMYGEEVDLCMRAKNNGFRIVVNPESTVLHRHQELSKDKFPPSYEIYYRSRNRVMRAFKNFGRKGYYQALGNLIFSMFRPSLKYIKYRKFSLLLLNSVILFDIISGRKGKRNLRLIHSDN